MAAIVETETPALTRADCAHAIAFHEYIDPAQRLRDTASALGGDPVDLYGTGAGLEAFECRIAEVLGKDAAVFMPSGTMAQQIALRIVADERGCRAFTGHSTNHLVLHERDGYALLHDLRFVPACPATRLMTPDDLTAVHDPVATLLVELPQREIGGLLPPWDVLVALTETARRRGWHLHLDGARLWESAPFYGRPYAEIAELFDTVYVSFYKSLGGLGGAMLAGSRDVIAAARIWQRRHGGNLFTLFPLAAIAEQSYDARIGRMGAYHEAALRVAAALARYPEVIVQPQPPHTNMLHAFIPLPADVLMQRAQRVARERGVWTIGRAGFTEVPWMMRWEISCGDATLALSETLLEAALDGLVRGATSGG